MRDAHLSANDQAAARSIDVQKASWVSVVVNLALTIAQLLVGWIAHSQSLIAHGLHSFSDLMSDFLVIWASRKGAVPADMDHPYGHARVETAATMVLGISLLLIGGGILWDAGTRLHEGATLPEIGMLAFWIAVLTVLAKEALYRYLIAVGRRLRSALVTANALHTRADAASALVVVVGIGGALLGWGFLDLLAALLMGFMILRMGAGMAWGAILELVDTGLNEVQVGAIRRSLLATPGVRGLHNLRTRRMAHQALVDAHVEVDPRISVTEGHRIAELARARVLSQHPDVLDVLVHVDPAENLGQDGTVIQMPGREELCSLLAPFLSGLPEPDRVAIHYVDGGVELEIYFRPAVDADLDNLQVLTRQLAEGAVALPLVRRLHCYWVLAP